MLGELDHLLQGEGEEGEGEGEAGGRVAAGSAGQGVGSNADGLVPRVLDHAFKRMIQVRG